ncbi:MAG TPA: ABC transporter substrate-binding protein [Gaiellaceae bacterium]|jgi:branched-chain amino acid transport system substrate-binding protein
MGLGIPRAAGRRRVLVLAAVIAVGVGASAVAALSATRALPPPQVLDYQRYVAAKGKAKASLAPVTLGFINGQGGPPNFNFPQPTRVIEAAVRMANAELGGIHGHPIRLNQCFIAQAEEEGVRCGQQMANDKNVKVILYGAVVVGNQSIYSTIKGSKPIIGGVTANAADPTAKNAYFLNGSQTSVLGPFGTYSKRFLPKVKSVAIVYPNQPGADTAAFALRKGMQQVGVKVTMIATPQLATDLLGPATQASSADMIIPALGFTDCVPFARALDQIHYSKPVLSTPLCTFIPKGAYAGGDLPTWTYGIAQTLVNLRSPQSSLYLKKGLQYGATVADMVNVFAEIAWEEALATIKIMNTIPYNKISSATISAGFKNFKGPLILAAPDIACGKASAGEPAVCGNETQFYNYLGKGKWKAASGWLKPPTAK